MVLHQSYIKGLIKNCEKHPTTPSPKFPHPSHPLACAHSGATPGPPTTVKRTPKYPCTVCDRGVRSNSKAVSCDNCELWTHINCCHMDGCDYNALQNSITYFSFFCINCLHGQLPFCDTIEVQHHEQRSICSENKSSPTEKKLYDCFKKKGLHMIHFNARSLLPNLAEVCTLVVEFNAAIVCVMDMA